MEIQFVWDSTNALMWAQMADGLWVQARHTVPERGRLPAPRFGSYIDDPAGELILAGDGTLRLGAAVSDTRSDAALVDRGWGRIWRGLALSKPLKIEGGAFCAHGVRFSRPIGTAEAAVLENRVLLPSETYDALRAFARQTGVSPGQMLARMVIEVYRDGEGSGK